MQNWVYLNSLYIDENYMFYITRQQMTSIFLWQGKFNPKIITTLNWNLIIDLYQPIPCYYKNKLNVKRILDMQEYVLAF